jgi:hypothetical protein
MRELSQILQELRLMIESPTATEDVRTLAAFVAELVESDPRSSVLKAPRIVNVLKLKKR